MPIKDRTIDIRRMMKISGKKICAVLPKTLIFDTARKFMIGKMQITYKKASLALYIKSLKKI